MLTFYFTEAIRSLKRQKGASLITVFVTSITIFITIITVASFYVTKFYGEKLISDVKVNLFLKDDLTEAKKNEIKNFLLSEDYIKKVEFIDKIKAKEEFLKDTGEDFSEILEVNPLPESFRLTLNSAKIDLNKISVIIKSLKNVNGVESVVYDYEYLLTLLDLLSSINIFLYVLSFITVFISIYLLYATNKLIYNARKDTYNIMKLVGAKISAIKIPIFINSILLSLTASTINIILTFFLIIGLTNIFNNVNFTKLIIFCILLTVIIGLVFGILGGIFSTKKINLKIERV